MEANMKKVLKFQNWVKIQYLYNRIFANYPFFEYFLAYENVLNLGRSLLKLCLYISIDISKKKLYQKKKKSSHKLLFLKYVTYRFYHFSDFLYFYKVKHT